MEAVAPAVAHVGTVHDGAHMLAAYNAAMCAVPFDDDAADDALDALLASGWRLNIHAKTYTLVSPSGEAYAPPASAPGGVRELD